MTQTLSYRKKASKSKSYTLPNGKKIHLRRIQMLVWGVIAGALGAGFIAGLYFGILQCNWHIFYLKPWWDGLFHGAAWWPVYRHTAFRDIPEPAIATMGVLTLLVKPKFWDRRVGNIRLFTAPLVMLMLTFALGIAGTWLLHYAFGHPVLTQYSIGNLLLGFAIGRLLHAYWAPVGATLQGNILDDVADKAAAKKRVPVWVKYPLAPPVLRERFTKMYKESKLVSYNLFSEGNSKYRKPMIIVGAVVFLLITALGLTGHYYAGSGHSIPWLTS